MQHPDGTVTQTRYLPFGGYRDGSGGNPMTDRGYTGHKHNDDLGLIYMNARYYVSGIARFASADTVIPDMTNPQAFNRYSYVYNSPLNFIDVNGHEPESIVGGFWSLNSLQTSTLFSNIDTHYGQLLEDYAALVTKCFVK